MAVQLAACEKIGVCNLPILVKTAFANATHSDGNEHNLINALRDSKSFIPELSLVAICQKKIVGHILFTKATIGEKPVLALAPLSALPLYQCQGIGQALIAKGHRIAQDLGYEYSIVLGHPQYYPKAGYRPASLYGIRAPFEIPEFENFSNNKYFVIRQQKILSLSKQS